MVQKDPKFQGGFVISLDFEMSWGVLDYLKANPDYQRNIEGEVTAVRAILDVFREYGIAATWATVGLIFAASAEEADSYRPTRIPKYANPEFSPYSNGNGNGFKGVPSLLFAPDLIGAIRDTPKQELATHTFSHFYCLEDGQSIDDFSADLDSALAIARARDVTITSIVFPRNQYNPAYDRVLVEKGITCYRGNPHTRIHRGTREAENKSIYRLGRLLDTYIDLTGNNTWEWNGLVNGGLVNIPASMFLRPVRHGEMPRRLQAKRIKAALDEAANEGKIFHLWWHPHNYGVDLESNISFLRSVLDDFKALEERTGIRSLNMADAAEIARAAV